MLNVTCPQNPVEQSYGGGDTINVRRLHEYCASANANFASIQAEYSRLLNIQRDLAAINVKLIQFVDWLAKTRPDIMDEFRTTIDVLSALEPNKEEQP